MMKDVVLTVFRGLLLAQYSRFHVSATSGAYYVWAEDMAQVVRWTEFWGMTVLNIVKIDHDEIGETDRFVLEG